MATRDPPLLVLPAEAPKTKHIMGQIGQMTGDSNVILRPQVRSDDVTWCRHMMSLHRVP